MKNKHKTKGTTSQSTTLNEKDMLREMLHGLPPLTIEEIQAAPGRRDEESERIIRYFQGGQTGVVDLLARADESAIGEVVQHPGICDAVRQICGAMKARYGSVPEDAEDFEIPEALARGALAEPGLGPTVESLPVMKFMESAIADPGLATAVSPAERKWVLFKVLSILFYFANAFMRLALSRAEFTQNVVAVLQRAAPDLKIEIAGDLELKLNAANGGEYVVNLHSPYRAYQTRRLEKDDIIAHCVSGYISMVTGNESKRIDRAHILPLLKTTDWLQDNEDEAALRAAGFTEVVQRRFNEDLIIVYVVDMPEYMTFLRGKDITTLGLDGEGLHRLAVENLERTFPGLVLGRKNGVYRVTCDGNYDASQILLDRFCNSAHYMVFGDPIVAVPAQDCLLMAGSEDKEGIRKLSEWAQEHFTNAVHPLSPRLLVRREGRFVPFEASPNA